MNINVPLFVTFLLSLSLSGCGGSGGNEPEPAPTIPPVVVVEDSDGDGINDDVDDCANTPSGDQVDTNGCTIVIVEGDEITVANGKLVGGPVSEKADFSVYVFDDDLVVPGESTCTGQCAVNWPPVLVSDGSASGISDLAMIERLDGSIQVTHKNRPLYFYAGDSSAGQTNGDNVAGWHSVDDSSVLAIKALYNSGTQLEPVTSYIRDDGVVVTRFGDRGRDRHAKDITVQDHYDHYLAHYWEYRTARVQLEDHVPNGESLIKATFITESELGAREFRVWFWGRTTTGQFHFNPQKEEEKVSQNESGVVYVGKGTWNDNFEKTSE
ncbi:MAG: putative lipoprotein with Yx(FWY)xxD motif, partial [Paraglaciecola sp.]